MEKVMEFSNEELREIAGCPMDYHDTTRNLAKALLAERDEREKNPGVWDGAPDNAIIAKVHFYKADKVYARTDGIPTVYTRTLPKTKAREIAERHFSAFENVLACEFAINEALGGEK